MLGSLGTQPQLHPHRINAGYREDHHVLFWYNSLRSFGYLREPFRQQALECTTNVDTISHQAPTTLAFLEDGSHVGAQPCCQCHPDSRLYQ